MWTLTTSPVLIRSWGQRKNTIKYNIEIKQKKDRQKIYNVSSIDSCFGEVVEAKILEVDMKIAL
jgi:hypothetical protein